MKYNSRRRRCLFDAPQWRWHRVEEALEYPKLHNQVEVHHERLGIYKVFVAAPAELYLILDNQKIEEVTGFIYKDKVFSMDTDQGNMPLWVYPKLPNFLLTY